MEVGEVDEGIDLDEPLLLTAYGDRTKKSGYLEVEKGESLEPLIWLDKSVGRPTKADDTDRIIFTQQTFVEFPDYWVSDDRFRNPRKVTDANPQQAEFAWSPGRVLIDYVDDRGNELQATLGLPAGLRGGQAVSHAGLLLRDHEPAPPLVSGPRLRRPTPHGHLRQQRVPGSSSRTSSTPSGSRGPPLWTT